VATAEVQEALAVDQLFGDGLKLKGFLLGELPVDPVALGGKERLKLAGSNILRSSQTETAVTLDR
jgi:hypothetical protein